MVNFQDRVVKTNLTNSDYEQLMTCDLINLKTCNATKMRFFAMTNWAQSYPLLEWSGQSLKDYYDGLIVKAFNYTEKIGFERTVMRTLNSAVVIENTKLNRFSYAYLSSETKLNCLNSSNVTIDFTWIKRPNYTNSYIMSLVNFTFYDYYSNINSTVSYDTTGNSMRRRRSVDDKFVALVLTIL